MAVLLPVRVLCKRLVQAPMSVDVYSSKNLQVGPSSTGCVGGCPGISLRFVILALGDNQIEVLCKSQLGGETWDLPEGGICSNEGIRKSAQKQLQSVTGMDRIFHDQLQTFGGSGKAPLTVAYYALLPPEVCSRVAPVYSNMRWWHWAHLPQLSEESEGLVQSAIRSLRLRAYYEPIIFSLLPKRFTLLQFQKVYETVLNVRIGKSNFRRKISRMDFLIPCQEWQQDVAHRAARLYEFDENAYIKFCESGSIFSF